MKRLLLSFLLVSSLFAQDDPVARARTLAQAGQRAEALQMLEARLAANPNDNDARTLYGTVLSWEGEYDRARTELQRVLASDPDNDDARQALARVEQWSRAQHGRPRREVSAGYTYEENFEEVHAAVKFGVVSLRAANADDDTQFELEAYPRIAARTYAYVAGGASTEHTRYPEWRAGAELFHGFGEGFEASLGVRRLEFTADAVDIQTASLGKYIGNWLILGRVYHSDDWTVQGQARRYFDDEGSFFGVRVGTSREEIRSGADVAALDETEIVGEVLRVFPSRFVVNARAGYGDGFIAAVTLGYRY